MELKRKNATRFGKISADTIEYNDELYAGLGMNLSSFWPLETNKSLQQQFQLIKSQLTSTSSVLFILGYPLAQPSAEWMDFLWREEIPTEWVSLPEAMDRVVWCRMDNRPFVALLLPHIQSNFLVR